MAFSFSRGREIAGRIVTLVWRMRAATIDARIARLLLDRNPQGMCQSPMKIDAARPWTKVQKGGSGARSVTV
ncbi:hypothetical protein [Paraburkholderia youngii]|uniref:hypothetical protein n=1 Tax=Paraburkholderia youngii TaxID=2782701 RepID=UPI003D1A5D08